MQMFKNIFAGMGGDSDDETVELQQKMTKIQKKKIQASTKAPTKNAEEGGDLKNFGVGGLGGVGDFETTKKQDRTRTAAKGGERGGDRQRGEGGNRGRGGDRPRTARGGRGGKDRGGFTGDSSRQNRTDAEGNVIRDRKPRQPREKHEGKDDKFGEKRFDRQDGTGKARRERKPRAGEETYKKKGEEGTPKQPVEEEKKEREPKIQYREEVVGYSLDEVLAGRTFGTKKEARATDGVKAKTQANDRTKEYQVSKQQNQYQKNATGKVVNENQALLGFGAKHLDRDEDEEEPRQRRNQEGGRGGRRQNPKQALKKTDDDFPTLA